MATTPPKIEIRSNEDAERVLGDLHRQMQAMADDNKAAIADRETFKANLDAISRKINSRNAPESLEDRDAARSVVALDSRALEGSDAQVGRDVIVHNGRALALSTIRSKNREIPGFLDSHAATPAQRRVQRLVTARNIIRAPLSANRLQRGSATPKLDQMIADELRAFPVAEVREAFSEEHLRIFANASGIGAATIFDYDMPDLERRIDGMRTVMGLFPVMQVSSNTFTWPYQTTRLRPYKGGVATQNNAPSFNISTIGSSNRQFALGKMVIRAQIDDDAAEDAFLDAIDLHMDEMSESYLWGEEDCGVNGDDATPHQDTALGSWDMRGMWGSDDAGLLDHRRVFRGLRARAFDASNVTNLSTTEVVDALRAARKTLKAPYGLMNCVHLVSYETMVGQLQASDDFKTIDKVGAALATQIGGNFQGPLPGQVGEIDGVPVVLSMMIPPDLPDTGLYTAPGTTTGALTLSRDRFVRVERRTRRIETDRDITRQLTDAVLSARMTFVAKPSDGPTDKLVHFIRNIPTT